MLVLLAVLAVAPQQSVADSSPFRALPLPAASGVGSPAMWRPKTVSRRPSESSHSHRATTMKANILPSRNSAAVILET